MKACNVSRFLTFVTKAYALFFGLSILVMMPLVTSLFLTGVLAGEVTGYLSFWSLSRLILSVNQKGRGGWRRLAILLVITLFKVVILFTIFTALILQFKIPPKALAIGLFLSQPALAVIFLTWSMKKTVAKTPSPDRMEDR